MLVPRSFKYTSAPDSKENASSPSTARRTMTPGSPKRSPITMPASPSPQTNTRPVTIPSPRSDKTSSPERNPSSVDTSQTAPPCYKSASLDSRRHRRPAHDPNALPPAVAALLAITAIPPRRPNRFRSRPGSDRRISIEELVRDWKSDDSLKSSSYGSRHALNILLEDTDECLFENGDSKSIADSPTYFTQRSVSSESMPSLESDDRSILSAGSPSTPESIRSRRSYQNLRKDKPRSLPAADCALDHPLAPRSQPEDDDMNLAIEKQAVASRKTRSSFKSNLTASLQIIKNAAVNSISSLGRANPGPTHHRMNAPPIDDMLWSYPFLFPRLSSEVRPTVQGHPSEAERRYLNPMPLTFEEQEAPFQQTLHAPFLAEVIEDAPTIQMQSYTRGRKRGHAKRNVANPNSEAGRALLGAAGVRQREARENSDFLRVVVLEMNMRREGKLEQGRAKIWLPPREVSPAPGQMRQEVPSRWVGVSAY